MSPESPAAGVIRPAVRGEWREVKQLGFVQEAMMFGTFNLSNDVSSARPTMMEVTMPAARRTPLILGRLAGPESPATTGEVAAARVALADPRSPADRSLDYVVDRLLEELSW